MTMADRTGTATTMSHTATGRDWRGITHRARQFLHIARALLRRVRRGHHRDTETQRERGFGTTDEH